MDTVRRSIDTEVSKTGDDCYRAVARLVDPFHEIEVVLLIRATGFVIVEASAKMIRIPYADKCPNSLQRVSKLSGLRIGPGLHRTIREVVGGDCGCPYIVDLVEQACKLVIVVSSVQQAREAVLVEHDLEKFAVIHEKMGQCAGHHNLPTGRLPDWLEHERRRNHSTDDVPGHEHE